MFFVLSLISFASANTNLQLTSFTSNVISTNNCQNNYVVFQAGSTPFLDIEFKCASDQTPASCGSFTGKAMSVPSLFEASCPKSIADARSKAISRMGSTPYVIYDFFSDGACQTSSGFCRISISCF